MFIWGYYKNQKMKIVLFFILILISSFISIINPLLFKVLIDNLHIVKGHKEIIGIIIVISFIACFVIVTEYVIVILDTNLMKKTNYSVRTQLINKLLKVNLSSTQLDQSKITQAVINDVPMIQGILNNIVIKSMSALISLIVVLYILFHIDSFMTLSILIIFPMYQLVYFLFNEKIQINSKKLIENRDELTSSIQKILANLRLIKTFNKKDSTYFLNYENVVQSISDNQFKAATSSGLFNAANSIAQFSLLIVVLAFGASQVSSEHLSIGSFVAFYMYIFQLSLPINQIYNNIVNLNTAFISIDRVRELFDLSEEQGADQISSNFFDKESGTNNITFNSVSLSLDHSRPILENLTFKLEKTKLNFIIGGNGIGKTSILLSLLGYVSVTNGELQINKNVISEIDINELRNKIGVVFQNDQFLGQSIKNNLKAENSGMILLINQIYNKLIKDYHENTNVESLSGGKRKVVQILSAIAKNPEILILDEAFANLDSESTEYIYDVLHSLKDEMIIIIVSHDYKYISKADNVVEIHEESRGQYGAQTSNIQLSIG
ncbi:ABC transporter transmembrane domain-containing protein [Paenibacillus sp. RS8]|uniref:ABC transporter transmembrane domain-containing protein n=1 Tax=Paenibacillus sp. RS8 TaxID=3242681 RepID=UPI0035BF77D3